MKRFLCAFVLMLSVLAPQLFAAENSPQKFLLDNGLTVVIDEMPSSSEVAIYAWVKTGSACEGKYLGTGVTHFVEHMLFKGTQRRAVGEIPVQAKAMGGEINAQTGYDHTVFTLSIPKDSFGKGLDLIADMMQNALIDPQELEREREVIVKEMHMINDRPERKLDDLVYSHVYLAHPYKYPIIGFENMFRGLTRDDVAEYYHSYYVPNNMILSVAGGVKAQEILPEIKKAFADFKARPFPLRNLPIEPEQISSRWVDAQYPSDLVRLTMAYQGVPLLHQDLYALDVLAMALGDGESSRMYQDLYKKMGLVQSVSASNYTPVDRGFLEINCLMTTDNAVAVVDRVKILLKEIARRGLSSLELTKVKRQVMADNIRGRQTAEGMAYRVAIEEAYTGDYLFSDKYLTGVRRVSNEDIKRVVRQYLSEDRLTVAVLKPVTTKVPALVSPEKSASDIERIALPNGLVLLLKEDHTLPIVSISTAIGGGVSQEPPELNGLSSLMARVWEKGFAGKSSDVISQETESRAAGFSVGAGRNSFGIGLSVLSEDLAFALDYLDKALKQPTFLQKEILKEKEQMLTALQARRDSIAQLSAKELREQLFLKHPFRLDSLGTPETLARINRQDLVDYYRRFLSSKNIVIAVFGDIDKDLVKQDIIRRFGTLKAPLVMLVSAAEDVPDSLRLKEMTMDKEQALVMVGFRAPDIFSPDKYSMEVAVNILSSGLGGRMFKRIRDELGKAYTMGGSFSPSVDAGMVLFYVLTTNDNVPKVRSIMEEEIKTLRSGSVSEDELKDTKNYLKSEQARNLQTIDAQAGTVAADELLGLGFDDFKAYSAHIDAVSADNVRQAAEKYFDMDHAALVITRSTEKKAGKNTVE